LSEITALLDKAARSFNAAERLLPTADVDFAVSRTYYGCFYIAEALLLDEGLSFSTHAAVIGEYGRLFAKTRKLDQRFHRLLMASFSLRQSAEYTTDFDLGDDDVRGMIEEGRAFLDAARGYMEHRSGEAPG
jgi:uncharacterized protein (UPF0332 family)